jgi:hypothetical protein
MEKVGMNMIEVILLIGLMYGVIRYWKWKLQGGYDLSLENLSYGIFLGGQLLSVFLMVISSVDEQILIYLEGLKVFGSGSLDFWTMLGVQLFGIVFLYMLSNVVVHLLYNSTLKRELSIYHELKNNNYSVALLLVILTLCVTHVTAVYVLKPFLFDWVSQQAKLIPMV